MSIFTELRRRNVFRVAASYVVVSWLILQVVSVIVRPLSLPDWFETVVVVLLVLGFPVAIVLAWAFELTPDGIRPAQPASSRTSTSASKLDFLLIAGLVVVAMATVWGNLRSPGINTPGPYSNDPSVAVLPFADMSPEGDQEYFGDGIAEELLNELTRLDGLRVAGRTSSFAFKDSNKDIQSIGRELNVAAVLEGSVRKDGDRIRITAQLIDSGNGFHVWSETYDRQFDDIFTIQEDIATSVAAMLGVTLGVGGVNSFRGAGTESVEAYELYLQAINMGGSAVADRSLPLLRRATAIDPEYSAAWAQMGLVTAATMWLGQPEEAPAILDEAHTYVERALSLDPDSVEVNTLMATVQYPRQEWVSSEVHYRTALAIERNLLTTTNYANMLMRAGRISDSARLHEESLSYVPEDQIPTGLRVYVSVAQRDFAEAERLVAFATADSTRAYRLFVALNERDENKIHSALRAMPADTVASRVLYGPLLENFASTDAARAVLQSALEDSASEWPSKPNDIAVFAAYFGDADLALRLKAAEIRHTPVRLGVMWSPLMADARRLPAFKELMTEIGLVENWREYGWSDFCSPLDNDDFVCE